MDSFMLRLAAALAILLAPHFLSAAELNSPEVLFQQIDGGLRVVIGGQTIAEYVYRGEQILRPYFKHLCTLSGMQVTRNSPPIKPGDLDDHPTMHPGLWLAFGDLGGADFWRNKGRVQHQQFVGDLQGGAGTGTFSVRNAYVDADRTICTEDCSITFLARQDGYRIDWTSTFRSDLADFAFGDQEEMGLGVRVATPMAVVNGGEIKDSQGRKNGQQVWGQQTNWCEYGGVINGRRIGIALMPDPKNFRRSWFHARDYGLLVANPFGQNAFTKRDKSKVVVPKGDTLRLRFGVLVYELLPNETLQIDAAYRDFVNAPALKP
jgi:hypothetical protein